MYRKLLYTREIIMKSTLAFLFYNLDNPLTKR